MNGKNTESLTIVRVVPVLLTLAVGMSIFFPTSAAAKSLYVLSDIAPSNEDRTLPVQAYDIGPDGSLMFQTQQSIPSRAGGPKGMAIDSDSGFVFITYEGLAAIQLIDPVTMTDAGRTEAPDATDLAGIVYDHKKKLLYTIDQGSGDLFAYKWDPSTTTLSAARGSPVSLEVAVPYGVALDENNGLLYVTNGGAYVAVYSTATWELVNTINVGRAAKSIALDVKNGFVYTGAADLGNIHLTQYHLPTGIKRDVQIGLDAGVMGLAVDPDTGLVYMSTGLKNETGGDDLLVYDSGLLLVDSVFNIGNPTVLAIPAKEVGYNPLNLRKSIVANDGSSLGTEVPPVGPGGMITYAIHFENNNSFAATNVSLVDTLPEDVIFVRADNATGNGRYDSKSRTYKWSYTAVPPGASETLELIVEVPKGVEMGKTIVNSVTIDSAEVPRTTTSASIVATNNPLHLTKSISGGAGDQVAGVDINEPVTYTICFDNNDNDFSVTEVTIVDVLPNEVTFVAAGEGKARGSYDAATHSFTWSYPFLLPGSSTCLGLIVRVNPDVAPGTVITNSAVIKSNETSPTTASVDAVMYLKPLTISKSIVGAEQDGQPKWVSAGDKITYAIGFQNKNDVPVSKVTIVDVLPKETSFVRARSDDPAAVGRYDAKSHTYTWSYSSLPASSSPTLLDIVVQVNKGVAPGTTITNSVTIDSDQTPPSTASAQAVTFYSVPSLSKYVVGSVIGEVEYVDTNDTVVYAVHFNNDNTSALTNVTIVDTLPQELNFVSADGDGSFGRYDAKAHAYTWTFDTLAPKSVTHLELKARVKKGVARQATITNLATVTSSEIAPATANVDVVVGGSPVRAQSLRMVPEAINRSGPTHEVQAVLILPAGIGKDAIKDTLPTLYPGRVRAKRQAVYGTATTAKVIAFFDKAELAAAISANGRIEVKVVGKLMTGPTFFAEAPLVINR